MVGTPLSSVTVGELGHRQVEIRESITSARVELSSDLASQFTFTVSDPGFRMHDAGYFVVRREVRYDGMVFEVAAVNARHSAGGTPEVRVDARARGVQRLKRDKGAVNYGSIAPTQFARQAAAKAGLSFFGQNTPTSGAIIRQANEISDDSSWDVLRRLASDAQFVVFEAGGILYFASETFILSRQPKITIPYPGNEQGPYYGIDWDLRRSDDNPTGGEFRVSLWDPNAHQIRPGMGVSITGIKYFSQTFMVTSVEWEPDTNNPVRLSGRTPETPTDVGCETRIFRIGMTDDCIKRIQQAVGAQPVDGIFGPITLAAVQAFQTLHGLVPDGIVGPQTWAAILGT